MRRIAIVLAVLLAACETISKAELAEIDYGPRPVGWRQASLNYLLPKMPDAKLAQISFPLEPKALAQGETMLRDRHWGWAICVHVFENHPDGKEETYPVTLFFRGEKMVFVNGGPGDRNPIGAAYAKRQCNDLGVPPIKLLPTRKD